MGWWSATIMGGDSPLDYLGVICDRMGAPFDYDRGEGLHGYHFSRNDLEKNMDAIVKMIEKEKWEQSVYWQVLGVMIMASGAKAGQTLKNRIIREAKSDPWMTEDGPKSERAHHINDFIKAMKSHRAGRVTRLTDEGLFQALAKIEGR